MTLTEQEVHAMIAEQKDFYFTGETRDVVFRKEMLLKLREAIIESEQDILDALYKDLGKSSFEAYTTEVGFVLSSIKDFVKSVDGWIRPEKVKTPLHLQPAKSFITREPYGSVLIIGPFNYPFQLVMEPLIGALIAGNCAVVKPSEFAVETGKVVKQILTSVFPADYVCVVEGEREATSALIHAPFDYIFFTGSEKVGKIVMKAAAERLTPITLELGGKSPVIVDPTANLKHAAERIIWGKFLNAGQTCVAPDYVLVHSSVKIALLREMTRALKKFYGKNVETSADYGRLIHHRHFEKLRDLLEHETENVIRGGRFNKETLYIEPTIVEADWDSILMKEEIFGPILPMIIYDNLEKVLQQVRQQPKPLAAYFFTENEQAENYFLETLPFGGGCINDTVTHVGNPNLPFGGVGQSGIGSYHGKASFELFTHAKSIMKRSTKIPMKVALPPYKGKMKLVKSLLR